MNTIRSVCVYCGSSPGRDEIYLKAGHALGRSIADSHLRLIYGGGTAAIIVFGGASSPAPGRRSSFGAAGSDG